MQREGQRLPPPMLLLLLLLLQLQVQKRIRWEDKERLRGRAVIQTWTCCPAAPRQAT